MQVHRLQAVPSVLQCSEPNKPPSQEHERLDPGSQEVFFTVSLSQREAPSEAMPTIKITRIK